MPRVFISYTHDSDGHKAAVRAVAEDLRTNGVDARFDQEVHGTPPEGWPAWMEGQVRDAEFVLVVATETYLRRYQGAERPNIGKGAIWEGGTIRQELYDSAGRNVKFAAVLLSEADTVHKPEPLRPHTHYLLPRDRVKLLRWLTNQPAYTPVPLGHVPVLPRDP